MPEKPIIVLAGNLQQFRDYARDYKGKEPLVYGNDYRKLSEIEASGVVEVGSFYQRTDHESFALRELAKSRVRSTMAEKYTCSMCHRTFDKFVTDAVANAEAEELWGVPNASERPDFSVVCDDCWQKVKPSDHPEQYAKAVAELGAPKLQKWERLPKLKKP